MYRQCLGVIVVGCRVNISSATSRSYSSASHDFLKIKCYVTQQVVIVGVRCCLRLLNAAFFSTNLCQEDEWNQQAGQNKE